MSADEYAEQAHQLVDFVIESAIRKLESENLTVPSSTTHLNAWQSRSNEEITAPVWEDYDVLNIDWPTVGTFSIEMAEEKIHQFIKTWDYQDSWLYCIDYLGNDDHEFDIRHRYRVRWSIPTRRTPIPRATASVYFTIQVSKIKPQDFPVEVYYVFETNQLVHRPGYSRFREKWLKDIIESKVALMDAVQI